RNEGRVDAQELGLRFVRIRDEAALEPVARAAQLGAGRGDESTRAAFRGGEHPAAVLQLVRELVAQGRQVIAHVQVLHSAMTSSVQNAATRSSSRMPKPPRQPPPLNARSAQPTGPGFAASKKRNSTKAASCVIHPAGRSTHSTIQKATTSSHTTEDGSATRMLRAVTVQAHHPSGSDSATRPPRCAGVSHCWSTRNTIQAQKVPQVPGAKGARPEPKPSASTCAGCDSMNAAVGRCGGSACADREGTSFMTRS